ncbi:glycosyltransferase [Rubrobacter indicoceani]|uniref:glycosyltransferase n=1 Tax=Rubrobacter indicoceani TaxID=2051957 RepID=UPI0013C41B66|nr:glycosyltransferase [Rubrobacter indicoceani]
MSSETARIALLVLGMHRSGTSAMSGMLSLLGAEPPERLVAADGTNEAGHWEPERLVALHDRMLAEVGSRWDDWRRFDPAKLGKERLAGYEAEISDLITADYGDAPLFVLKDPRICRFVPLYKKVLAGMGVEPRYVLTYRNPLSVLDSLDARDDMTPSYAAAVWLRHVLDAERNTRNGTRSFVAYEDFMADWRSVAGQLSGELGLRWPVDPEKSGVDDFLLQALQHHRATPERWDADLRFEPALRDVYASLLELSKNVSDAGALETLTQLKEEFDLSRSDPVDATFEEISRRQQREQMNVEHLQRLVADLQKRAAEYEELSLPATDEAAISELESQYAELESQLAKERKQTAALVTQRAGLKAQIETLRGELGARGGLGLNPTRLRRTARRLVSDPASVLRAVRRLRPVSPAKAENPTSPNEPLPGAANLSEEELERVRRAFDEGFYLTAYPDVAAGEEDPFRHYMRVGWKGGRNPTPRFSTRYYLQTNPDIAQAGINPFAHWVLHGYRNKRPTVPFARRLELLDYAPKVSVIVPNYNHARFLGRRLDSILDQTYRNIEVLVLDDRSTDNSRKVIEEYQEKHPDRIRTLFNEQNSGNVFRQWRRGVEASEGELVWICESDDFCEEDFLEGLVEKFRDRSVNLAFGRIQFADRNGDLLQGMDQYRETAEPGIWAEKTSRPAREWFTNGFGVNNVVANVGGCVFRRQTLPDSVWDEAGNYSVLGDWFLYIHLAGGGKIAYEPASVAYFRQHGGNTSVAAFKTEGFYREHERLMSLLRRRWDVPERTVRAFQEKIAFQYGRFGLEEKFGKPLTEYCDPERLMAVAPTEKHYLIAFLGFHSGGGEVFPLHLANELRAQGRLVSMLAMDLSDVQPEMHDALDPAIPVYDSSWVREYGADEFLTGAGVSLVHSHIIAVEAFFFEECEITRSVPYLVTLHGSYDSAALSRERLFRIVLNTNHFVYTAEKNLAPFRRLPLSDDIFTKLTNALPDDPHPFPKSREELGIAEDAVVFTLVARGIRRKGWRASIAAFQKLRDAGPPGAVHLLLCGDGEEKERQEALHGRDRDITFLGYQSRIDGLYRLSDVALVPTRFAGESYPLCITQALQTGTPVISTKIGEIESMMDGTDGPGGILLDYERDTGLYIERLEEAMSRMMDGETREKYARLAGRKGETFSMEKVAKDYVRLYEELVR